MSPIYIEYLVTVMIIYPLYILFDYLFKHKMKKIAYRQDLILSLFVSLILTAQSRKIINMPFDDIFGRYRRVFIDNSK